MSKELLFVMDTETTGLSIKTDRVCQLGVVAAFIDREARDISYIIVADELCRPGDLVIPAEASKIHGVTNEMVRHAPPDYEVIDATWKKMMGLVEQFMDETPDGQVAIGGYNTNRFDFPLLANIHPGIRDAIADPAVVRVDGLPLAQRWYKDTRHKLGMMYEYLFNEAPVNAHNATADCIMTGRVIARMLADNNFTFQEAHDFCGKPQILERWPFGKHEGKRCDEIERSYYVWVKQNWTDMSPDILATVNHQLATRKG